MISADLSKMNKIVGGKCKKKKKQNPEKTGRLSHFMSDRSVILKYEVLCKMVILVGKTTGRKCKVIHLDFCPLLISQHQLLLNGWNRRTLAVLSAFIMSPREQWWMTVTSCIWAFPESVWKLNQFSFRAGDTCAGIFRRVWVLSWCPANWAVWSCHLKTRRTLEYH